MHQPADAVCLVPLLQKLSKRPIECNLPTLDCARDSGCMASAVLRMDKSLGKAFPKQIGVIIEHGFEGLLSKGKVLAHGLISFTA